MVLRKSLHILLILALTVLFTCGAVFAGGGQSPSGKTIANLVDEVEYLVDEDPYFTSAQIIVYLNSAVADVTWKSGCTESGTSIIVTAGTTEYALDVSYGTITNISWQETGTTAYKSLLRGDPQTLGWQTSGSDRPLYWYERAGKVGIYPMVDSDNITITGSTCYVTYTPIHTTLTSTDYVPTPAVLDQALVYYAAAQCFLRDRQYVAYSQMMAAYGRELQMYVALTTRREHPMEAVR